LSREQSRGVTPALTPDRLAALRGAAAGDRALRIARNAVTAADVNAVALNRDAVVALDPTTEVKLDSLGVSDQKQSGRCWMFAAYNVFRHRVAERARRHGVRVLAHLPAVPRQDREVAPRAAVAGDSCSARG
jgi:bleomycin hydrolase